MKVAIEQIQKGLTQFIDNEISSQLKGWEKIGFCTAAALIIRNLPATLDLYKNNNLIQMLGVIDDKDQVDIDALYEATSSYLTEEYIDIPIAKMRLKITKNDLDKLYNIIKEA